MSYRDCCPFQQIFNIQSSVKVTSFLFNIVSFVRNTSPTMSSFYYKLIKCFCKTTTFPKADITQKEPTTSV